MFNKDKGEYGYLKSYKKMRLFFSCLFGVVILGIIILLLVLFKTTKTVYVVVPILLALPFSKNFIGYILCVKFKPLNEEKYNTLKRFEVKAGDFIMSCRGTIGKLYQLPSNAPKGIIHPSLMKIRIKTESYLPTYFQFMLTKIVANQTTNGNCVQMAITAKELGKKDLPVPPLSIQEEFAKRIEAVEQQKTQIITTIKDLETLLASRMQYWFD